VKLPSFAARSLPQVIDALAHFPSDHEQGIRELLEIDADRAKALLEGAELLGLIVDGSPDRLASLIRDASLVERRQILRLYVESFPPYSTWKRKIAQGFEPLEAARQVKAIFTIEDPPAAIRDWFLDLGGYSGSVTEEAPGITPVRGGDVGLGSLLSGLLDSAESRTQALSDYLGPALWAKLPPAATEHLDAALSKLASNEDPSEVVREAGMAMDNYMADLGASVKGGYAGLTMGQAAKELLDDGLLVSKQQGFTSYGTNLRNAAEHPDTDADLNGARWEITGKGALTYLRVVLDFIRSANAKLEGRFEV
jgi:hypothetical protein